MFMKMTEYNIKGTYGPASLEDVVGEINLSNKPASAEENLFKNRKLLLTGLALCTFVLGSVPAAASVDFEKKLNFPYALDSMYALISILTFVPKIEDYGFKAARYAGLLGTALGMTYFYYLFGGHN